MAREETSSYIVQRYLFARWNRVGSNSYLAGIYDEQVHESVQIRADEDWDRLVLRWNDMRITSIALVGTDSALATAGGPGSVQILRRPTHENPWITMQGLLVSRIDSFEEYHQRILWNCASPLLCNDLPEEPTFNSLVRRYKDIDAQILFLKGVSGISVALCNGKIEAIHLHRENHDSSSMYEQMHEWATWKYCPIEEGETIVGIWLVEHSPGTGLAVKTRHEFVWLCSYYGPWSSQETVQLLALAETRASYHSSCMRYFGSIPALPTEYQTVELCNFPELPFFLLGRDQSQWSFSAASLNNVTAVRMSRGGGIELRYNDFSQCLGNFRPNKTLERLENPAYLKVCHIDQTRHIITFFNDEGIENREAGALSLSGRYIVFWTNKNDSIMEVKDSM